LSTPADARSVDRASEGSLGANSFPGEEAYADGFYGKRIAARWKLTLGTFEVAEMQGERWLRCASEDGRIHMKMPPALPEFWTLEFDFYCADPAPSNALT